MSEQPWTFPSESIHSVKQSQITLIEPQGDEKITSSRSHRAALSRGFIDFVSGGSICWGIYARICLGRFPHVVHLMVNPPLKTQTNDRSTTLHYRGLNYVQGIYFQMNLNINLLFFTQLYIGEKSTVYKWLHM